MKPPLKTVLKNFLDHVEDLEARKKLCDDQYETEFQELKKLTDKLKEDPAYQCSFGLKDVNRPKNRYKDIVPYDFSRVILPKYEGVPGSDYINASYVKGASGALAYIAAQGPLPNTVIDFWRMIWVCDVQVLVMACNEKEAGKYKCEAYWPVPGEVRQYGNISIELVNTSQVCPDFLIRTLLVKNGSDMRDVYQFHYTSWPDHGVPDTVQPILDLIRLMRDLQASETVPIVVHCSAGCGRTGTICAVDFVWACLRHGKLDEDFSLYQIALELRRQRIAMIQTKEQYILAHKAVAAMFEQQLKVIDCHIYENLDEDGEPLIWKEVGKDKEFDIPDFMKKIDTKEKPPLAPIERKKSLVESKRSPPSSVSQKITNKASSVDTLSCNSSTGNNLNMKAIGADCINSSSRNSESSYSRNSILSQHSTEDSIPFIDEDDVCIRPNCGRAYLDMPSCDSISKLVNCFDPFVDKLSVGTDDSSPDGDATEISNKMKDFQVIASKTLDRNAKISAFKDSKSQKNNDIKIENSKFDIIDSAKKPVLPNRESYPPSTSTSEKFEKNYTNITAEEENSVSSEDAKEGKKVGKATVVRRPSVSKLKALFEKSGISGQKPSADGSKRLLFRNNSHNVCRSGSAPPSLDCMDKNSAAERESILKMVTRKFRSSSVRTEREMQAKQPDKTLHRRSATDTVKDGLNALSRTMSFTINKTFKSYSPAKMKSSGGNNRSSASSPSDSVAGIYKPKSPDQPKGNSMWYDKSSLPRAIAIVKPTGKFEDVDPQAVPSKMSPPPDPKSPDKNKTHETHFTYMAKPAKLKDFFSSLNKKDAKDPTALWYNESDQIVHCGPESNNTDLASKSGSVSSPTRSSSKVLPFLPLTSWKKVHKSSSSSPDSPKSFDESTATRSSTFYTNVVNTDKTIVNLPCEKSSKELPICPVPEEIIPLNPDHLNNAFWPSSSVSSSTFLSTCSEKSTSNLSVTEDVNIPDQPINAEVLENEQDAKANTLKQTANTAICKSECDTDAGILNDARPAIPKKMVIGKSKNLQNMLFDKVSEQIAPQHLQTNEDMIESTSESNPPTEQNIKPNSVLEKKDLYINVNIKAMKNIEQIENSLRKNPRGAIIDLTSRESYSMEEELVNAVNQLSESSEKIQVPPVVPIKGRDKNISLPTTDNDKKNISVPTIDKDKNISVPTTDNDTKNISVPSVDKDKNTSVPSTDNKKNISVPTTDKDNNIMLGAKNSSKFPGYEVIWPEQPCVPIQKSKSSSKVPSMSNSKLSDKNAETVLFNQIKTGLCYSPPLRRSINANMALAKSQSLVNLGWSESDDPIVNLKEQSNTPTKRLVNEAVVELNTLLNQLTTRTLSEDIDFAASSKEKIPPSLEVKKEKSKKPIESNIEPNDTVVHSVTLVSKSYSGTSPKEEEIVFHFPPPPRVPPPPKDESPVESFSIVCQNGSLVLNESSGKDTSVKLRGAIKMENSELSSNSSSSNSSNTSADEATSKNKPLPMPRKSKQTDGLKRSSSYSNIVPPQNKNKGYENVFLEKYQTLSRLEIKTDCGDINGHDKLLPSQKSPLMCRSPNTKVSSGYVNVGAMNCVDVQSSLKIKPEASVKSCQLDKSKETVENVNHAIIKLSNQASLDKFRIADEGKGAESIYGKIYKISDKNAQVSATNASISASQDVGEVKRKPVLSKKTERAPLPPSMKPTQVIGNEMNSRTSPNSSMIPKKLPSRKLEKAPPPPHIIQKSLSTANLPKKNLQGPPPYVNISAIHQMEEKPKLPSVRENLPNITHNAQVINKTSNPSVTQNKFVSRGLSHSQSDVSVYLALKERRIQSANQQRKITNMKSLLMNKKANADPAVSSSDSDSSYEKIFSKNDEPRSTASENVSKDQIEQMPVRSYKKDFPVAPPRSKRRSTTEVQYAKVKPRNASHISTASQLPEEKDIKNTKADLSYNEDDPPPVPLKTKDAFEIPGEILTDLNKRTGEVHSKVLPNLKSSK